MRKSKTFLQNFLEGGIIFYYFITKILIELLTLIHCLIEIKQVAMDVFLTLSHSALIVYAS